MRILLVGSGGREHALALGLHQDPAVTDLHCAPGNPGIAEFATLHPVDVTDNSAITSLAQSLAVDLVVVGPEVPSSMASQVHFVPRVFLPLAPQRLQRN